MVISSSAAKFPVVMISTIFSENWFININDVPQTFGVATIYNATKNK